MTPSFPFSVSLLALRNDEAVLVLCYAVLEGNCLSSMLTMACSGMGCQLLQENAVGNAAKGFPKVQVEDNMHSLFLIPRQVTWS